MGIEIDENGYLYVFNYATGEKRYILVDMPNCSHYGKLKLGEAESEGE